MATIKGYSAPIEEAAPVGIGKTLMKGFTKVKKAAVAHPLATTAAVAAPVGIGAGIAMKHRADTQRSQQVQGQANMLRAKKGLAVESAIITGYRLLGEAVPQPGMIKSGFQTIGNIFKTGLGAGRTAAQGASAATGMAAKAAPYVVAGGAGLGAGVAAGKALAGEPNKKTQAAKVQLAQAKAARSRR